jgi:hypothetical protein
MFFILIVEIIFGLWWAKRLLTADLREHDGADGGTMKRVLQTFAWQSALVLLVFFPLMSAFGGETVAGIGELAGGTFGLNLIVFAILLTAVFFVVRAAVRREKK